MVSGIVSYKSNINSRFSNNRDRENDNKIKIQCLICANDVNLQQMFVSGLKKNIYVE